MNVWTDNEFRILKELKKICLINMFLQSGSAYVNFVLHNAITIPNIALGAATSISIFSTSNAGWRIAGGVMAACCTLLSGLARQLGAGERAQVHATVTKQYHSIIRDINVRMMMEPSAEERSRFIEHIKAEVDRVFTLQPDPSIWIVRRFEHRYQEHVEKVTFPDMEATFMRNAERISNRISSYRVPATGRQSQPAATSPHTRKYGSSAALSYSPMSIREDDEMGV